MKHSKKSSYKIGVICIALASIILLIYMKQNTKHIMIGAWTAGMRDNSKKIIKVKVLKDFEENIGKKVAIAHIYIGWHELDSDASMSNLKELSDNSWVPMVSSNPYFFEECKPSGLSLYKTIANGECDDFLHRIAKRMHDYQHIILFRFAWEMNIPANEWSLDYTKSNPKDFIEAWRHMHDIFAEEKATNVRWVFCPNVKEDETQEFEFAYPGEAYVDWVGLDGYNWGTSQSWSSWQNFHDVFYPSYKKFESIAPNKPMILGEFGSTDVGGDKPAWLSNMLVEELPQNFPQIKAIVFYDENRATQENVNWRLKTPPSALEAVRNSLKDSIYTSQFEDKK